MTRQRLRQLAADFSRRIDNLHFSRPVMFVYNPLHYAWPGFCAYLDQYANGNKSVVFLGMNPGPWGMAQTGVPFGEIAAVRDWLGIDAAIGRPEREHPKRPVTGFDCRRSEVSGRRLWGLFRKHFPTADCFFQDHFVANYCPLLFLEESGRNLTPDKLPTADREPLLKMCDDHLARFVDELRPRWLVGVGKFAADAARRSLAGRDIGIVQILHPSPANPQANRDWAGRVTRTLRERNIWG
ncbi:MAG: single-stranded DNA-binding protein [Acidobacteria bacterium]|nr:single-stranded DNA-binding protein [Acidobacteriota bacterium]